MFLFIIVSIIVAVNIKKINGMENIYLKYFIYFLLFNFFLKEMYNLYLSYFGKKSVTVTITVNPLKKLTIRSKPEFGIIADSMTSDKNGVVSFVIQQTGKENIYTELIYYRYTDQPKSAVASLVTASEAVRFPQELGGQCGTQNPQKVQIN